MKLSIIVPVYNVEKYIIKCISSLLCQDYADYEIIIVNDGTEDRSIKLIQQNFDDLRIRIINQENQGGRARRRRDQAHQHRSRQHGREAGAYAAQDVPCHVQGHSRHHRQTRRPPA